MRDAGSCGVLEVNGLLSIEANSQHLWFGRWWLPGSLHVWIGPLGLHLFFPGLRCSQFDYCRTWHELDTR